jgi:hypothetical protein
MGKLFDEIAGSFNETAQDKSKAVQQNSSVKDLDAFFETRFGKRKKEEEEVESTSKAPALTKLSPLAERMFQADYAKYAKQTGMSSNPDDPEHFYDYRALFQDTGKISPDDSGHLPSKYKLEGHPNLVVDGVNTKTGKPIKEDVPEFSLEGKFPDALAAAKMGRAATEDTKRVQALNDEARLKQDEISKLPKVKIDEFYTWPGIKEKVDAVVPDSSSSTSTLKENPKELKAKELVLEEVSKELDIPKEDISKDMLYEYAQTRQWNTQMSRRQRVGRVMTGLIAAPTLAAGAAGAAPLTVAGVALKTVIGVASFMAIDEGISYVASKIAGKDHQFLSGKSAVDILAPEDTSELVKDLGWGAQLVVSGIILGKGFSASRNTYLKVAEKYFKEKFTEYKVKPDVTITPEQLREFHGNQRPEIISKEVSDLLKDLGLSRTEYVKALKNGLEVSFAAEKLVWLVDKPAYKKLKNILGIKSEPRLLSREEIERGYRMRPSGLIEAPKEGKQEAAPAQPSPQSPVQPTPVEPRVETPAEVAKEQVRSIVAKTAETVLEKTDLGNRTAALSEALQEVNKLGLANSHGWNAIVAGRKDIATADLPDYYKREIEKLAKTVKSKTESDVPLNVGEQKTTDTISEEAKKTYKVTAKDNEGNILVGKVGETHPQFIQRLIEEGKDVSWGTETGFITDKGDYLKQEQSKKVEKILDAGKPKVQEKSKIDVVTGTKAHEVVKAEHDANAPAGTEGQHVSPEVQAMMDKSAEASKKLSQEEVDARILTRQAKPGTDKIVKTKHSELPKKEVTKETPLRLKPKAEEKKIESKKIEEKKTSLEGTTKYLGKDYKVGKTIPAGQTTGEGVNQKAAKDYDRVELLNPTTGEVEVIVKASSIKKPDYLAKGNTAEFIPPVEKGTITLGTVKKQFPSAEVIQPGGENSPIYIKTPGGTYLTVENVASIAPDKRAFKIGYGREFNPETDFIPEQYVDGVLTFVRGEAGQWTLDHANMHMLEDLGLITAKEIDAFKQQAIKEINAGKRKSANKEDIGGKEDRANIYAEMMGRRRRDKNFLEKIIDRVKDFLARLFKAFSNKAKARNVTREAETGDIYKRTETQAEKGTPQLLELKEYGEKLYNEGATTYNDWLGKMKEHLGKAYENFKDSLREIYNEIIRKVSNERGSTNEGENIFKGLGKDIADAYKRTGKSLDKLLGEMSTRLGNIHPTLKSRIREFEYRKGKLEVGLKKKALESISAFRKMSPEDLKAFDMARKNSNGTELKRLVTKYHLGKEYHTLREIYTFLYTAAKEVGMAGGYTNNYHAREVKDLEGLRNFLYKTNDWSVYELAFQEYKQKKDIGRPLTQEEQIRIINTLLRGDSPSTITLLTPDQLKRRYIKEVTPEIDKFFSDSDSAFLRYITDMVEAIEARRFFGRGLKDTQDLENSIGAFVMRATIDKHITPAQSEELYQILHARFKQQGTHGIITAVKNIALVDTLGSVFSAIRQLGDYTWALYDFGLITTGKAAKGAWTGKSLITKEDAGISRIAVEFSDMSKTGKFVDWVFESKGTGFSFVDKTGKEMLLNGAFIDARKTLANPKTREAFIKELEVLVGDRAPQAVKEFEDNKVTYLTEFYSVCKLADYQPIWVSEMPEIYARAGNGRIFYMLKSFTLKMFDVFRREAFQKIKTPGQRAKGIKNLIKLATIFLLANAGASIIQDLLLGRDIEITDSITENIWQLFGLSRYFGYRVPQEGAGTALLMNILPPMKAINAISKDIAEWGDGTGFRVTESIPFVGKIYYWRFGKGSKMMEKRKDKEAKSKASAERKASKVPNPSQYRFRSSKVPSPRDYRLK